MEYSEFRNLSEKYSFAYKQFRELNNKTNSLYLANLSFYILETLMLNGEFDESFGGNLPQEMKEELIESKKIADYVKRRLCQYTEKSNQRTRILSETNELFNKSLSDNWALDEMHSLFMHYVRVIGLISKDQINEETIDSDIDLHIKEIGYIDDHVKIIKLINLFQKKLSDLVSNNEANEKANEEYESYIRFKDEFDIDYIANIRSEDEICTECFQINCACERL